MTEPTPLSGRHRPLLAHIRARLQTNLDPRFVYHDIYHTFNDVMPAALYLADACHLAEEQRVLLEVGVALHDFGFTVGRREHEKLGVEIAQLLLPRHGFDAREIATVSGLIRATRMPQSPHNLLEEIMADADLDVLGRADFLDRNQLLHQELVAFEGPIERRDWIREQLQFLDNHRYFTAAARQRRRLGKMANRQALLAELAR